MMKKIRKKISVFAALLLFLTTVFPKASFATQKKEFRAVWVSSVYGIDYPKQASTDAESLKRQARDILNGAKSFGMTAVILQVRPSADSLYPSSYFPWSRYLTGEQGRAPENDFDPLAYWVSEAHARGLELHAWVNPFRVANSDAEYEQMSEEHIAKQKEDWVVRHSNGKYYFNPGIPELRQYVIDAAQEIVTRYEVDGLHLDDYFYPGEEFADEESYRQYGTDFADIGDWRRNNIDRLVSELHDMTKHCGRKLSFGVSPSGIWANASNIETGSETKGNQSYFSSYADSRKWVQNGWVDYICPQLYWHIGHPAADYKTLAEWWARQVRGTGVRLYLGMADYQTGNESENSAWHGIGAITDAIALNESLEEVSGEVHFSYSSIVDSPELTAYYQNHYGEAKPKTISLNQTSGEAYIVGSEGKFYPEQPLLRAQTAKIFSELAVNENGESCYREEEIVWSRYSDVARTAWYAAPIGFMSDNNIMKGYENGCFYPERAITRAEFAALIFRLQQDGKERQASHFFDVSEQHWATQAIAFSAEKGYLSGYEDGSFRPEREITRAEAVTVLNRVLGRSTGNATLPEQSIFSDVSEQHWAFHEIMRAATTQMS